MIRCASMTYEFLVTRELEGSLVRVACTTFQESAGSSHAPGPLCLLIQVVRIFSEPTLSMRRAEPALVLQPVPRSANVLRPHQLALAVVPCVNRCDRIV